MGVLRSWKKRAFFGVACTMGALGWNLGEARAAGVCDGISGSGETARARMIAEVVSDPGRRAALVTELQEGRGGRCRDVLAATVDGVLARKDSPSDKGRSALLLLAVRGRVPRIDEVLQLEIREGRGDDLLDALRDADKVRYRATLLEWLVGAATAIRATRDLEAGQGADYGARGLKEEDAERDRVRLASPLVFERCLRLLKEDDTALAKPEISALNVIFAASTSAYRQAFLPELKSIFSRHTALWIPEFRREPVWVQVRLFPLMTAVGGPEVVRELMWLSKNHADLRVRGLADHALDALLEGKSR